MPCSSDTAPPPQVARGAPRHSGLSRPLEKDPNPLMGLVALLLLTEAPAVEVLIVVGSTKPPPAPLCCPSGCPCAQAGVGNAVKE
jgi:hypothetical protein